MMSAVRNAFIFVLLAGAAIATWLLGRPPAELERAALRRPAPLGYYLRDATILGTNADGVVSYRIYAGLLEQPEQDRSLVLTDVRVEYDARENIPWRVTAPHASAESGGEYLRLYGGVELSSEPEDGTTAIMIETPELEFKPEAYVASGAQPVTYSRGDTKLRAESFTADLKEDLIDMVSVHAEFHR
jgi:LPS export ABC transporter protein LptC